MGAMVHLEFDGESCAEIANALEGFEQLNKTLDLMCGDLGKRIYPDDDTELGNAAAPHGGEKET
jgi:hypothetical protein